MNEKLICDKCNYENVDNSKFCTNCGAKIINNEDIIKKKGDKICILSILSTLAVVILILYGQLYGFGKNIIIGCLIMGFFLCGLVTMIYGRVKYPKNKNLKFLMWIYIVIVVIEIISLIYLFISLNAICESIVGCIRSGQFD